MAVCGHQFRGGDESDWLLSTSANLVTGSSTAQRILEELFKKRCNKINKNTKKIKQETQDLSKEPPPTFKPPQPQKPPPPPLVRELIVKKMSGGLENFDHSQHLNGCPIKWLYNKRLLDKRNYRVVGRWCSKKSEREGEERRKKEKSKSGGNLRDKTPAEVKIHKINLTEKYTGNENESYLPSPSIKPEANWVESQRKKLAAKLNWKLHDESKDDSRLETSSDLSFRSNYLPPRPLLGLKPILSILLTPEKYTTCCYPGDYLQKNSAREKIGATLTIQSLDFPLFPAETKPRPKTTHVPRWGAKSTRLQKKFQIPNQITINLRKASDPAPDHAPRLLSGLSTKKLADKTKHPKSLSSLFYELKDKTNCRNQSEKCFEEIIRELMMDDDQFKMKRFLSNSDSENKRFREKKNGSESGDLVCGRMRIFEKFPHSNKLKKEQNEGQVPTKG